MLVYSSYVNESLELWRKHSVPIGVSQSLITLPTKDEHRYIELLKKILYQRLKYTTVISYLKITAKKVRAGAEVFNDAQKGKLHHGSKSDKSHLNNFWIWYILFS